MDRATLAGLIGVREEMIAAGRPNRPGTVIRPRFITIHNTSNSGRGANAAAHARFVTRTGHYVLADGRKSWVSWHVTVDDREAVRHLPLREKGLHAGPGNGASIAIEVCMHAGIDQAAANLRAARLAALLAFDLSLGAGSLRTHKSWTGKACPVLLLPGFAAFAAEMEAIRRSITGTPEMEPLPESAEDEAALFAEGAGYDDAEIDHELMGEAIAAELAEA